MLDGTVYFSCCSSREVQLSETACVRHILIFKNSDDLGFSRAWYSPAGFPRQLRCLLVNSREVGRLQGSTPRRHRSDIVNSVLRHRLLAFYAHASGEGQVRPGSLGFKWSCVCFSCFAPRPPSSSCACSGLPEQQDQRRPKGTSSISAACTGKVPYTITSCLLLVPSPVDSRPRHSSQVSSRGNRLTAHDLFGSRRHGLPFLFLFHFRLQP